jgi:hypothetical protein
MRRVHSFIVPVLLAALAGCTTTSQPERQSETLPDANLPAYETFGWQAPAGEGGIDEPMRILDVNIRAAIRAELTQRGYRETDVNPQFRIAYETALQDKLKNSPVRFGIGMGSFGGNVGGSVNMGSPSVQSYQEGSLVIHVLDAARNQEVWSGTVSGRVDKKNLDAAAVARVVALAMQDYPARATANAPASAPAP